MPCDKGIYRERERERGKQRERGVRQMRRQRERAGSTSVSLQVVSNWTCCTDPVEWFSSCTHTHSCHELQLLHAQNFNLFTVYILSPCQHIPPHEGKRAQNVRGNKVHWRRAVQLVLYWSLPGCVCIIKIWACEHVYKVKTHKKQDCDPLWVWLIVSESLM